MRRGILSMLTLILLTGGLLAPTAALASDDVSIANLPPREESRFARAHFVKYGRCSRTGMSVVANMADNLNDPLQGGNRAEHVLTLRFSMFRENLCTGEEVNSIEWGDVVENVSISANYRQASVKETFMARDFRNDLDVPVTVDLTWTGKSPLQVEQTVEQVIVDSNGTPLTLERTTRDFARAARASGTITIGDEVYTLRVADEDTMLYGFKVNTVQVQ